jgi:tRNA uridine 5-carboxymethylaminomethyl modification enzyme
MRHYSVIIIGGGHAGIEACFTVAKFAKMNNDKVALITLKESNIGDMSCNPAMGGIGKGHLMREVDALGGIIARCSDKSGIHFKVLNKSKGSAVWGPRAQIDRKLYKKYMMEYISNIDNLDIIYDNVMEIDIKNDNAKGVYLKNGGYISANAVILTAGTFLNGRIQVGTKITNAGRIGEENSVGMKEMLKKYDFDIGRLKTGTPARLDKNSINFDELEEQEPDEIAEPFSYMNNKINPPKVKCHISYTSQETKDVILANKDLSPVLRGDVSTKGPRYCPSIEDKIRRFPDKEIHRVFFEPEGLDSDLIYPNGISTSLPEDIQLKFLRTLKGCKNVIMRQAGYVVEYDFINPIELKATLETKKINNLFFAGQINGTTGYEEAAAQGVIAAINAGLKAYKLHNNEFILSRSESYIGVMIDDLTTKGIIEPYRMFTSRSEYRLLLRSDNADIRLTEKAIDLNICEESRGVIFNKRKDDINDIKKLLKSKSFTPNELKKIDVNISQDGIRRNGIELLSLQNVTMDHINNLFDNKLNKYDEREISYVSTEAKYSVYLNRQKEDVKMFMENELIKIPSDIDYKKIGSLSSEVIDILSKARPENLGQCGRIQGVTPASIIAISIYLKMGK